jgi:hypothetical protein
MRALAGIGGAVLIALMFAEFFVTFMLPRRVRRDPRIARSLNRLLWRPWRGAAARLAPAPGDTMLGLYGPLALLTQLVVWALGLVLGFALLEWAVAGGAFWDRIFFSSGLFLSAGAAEGSNAVRAVELLEAATGVAVLFIVIGYMPSVYSAFSRRESAVSQFAPRAGTPPAAGVVIHRAIGHQHWQELRQELQAWEEWSAELMETHLSYPLLAFYRSQHVSQNWLASLTVMVDVAAFVKATAPDGKVRPADVTFAIGRHALADLTLQFQLQPLAADRLSREEFADLYAIVEAAADDAVEEEDGWRRLAALRDEYEPNAAALADFLALGLPAWTAAVAPERPSVREPSLRVGSDGRDLVG